MDPINAYSLPYWICTCNHCGFSLASEDRDQIEDVVQRHIDNSDHSFASYTTIYKTS